MKHTYAFLLLSMPYTLLSMPYTAAHAGIRVGNLSRSNAAGYQAVNEMRYRADIANQVAAANVAPVELPVAVENSTLAEKIRSGDTNVSVGMDSLERCSMIYPNGEFAWAHPTVGMGIGGAATCTAVVEMRAIGAGENGRDAILARANLAAGDAIKCNISEFSEASWLPAAGEIEFPADNEPTMDDVISVMNREQKQNAGLKIAAAAVIGGLGGNIAGKNEVGSDSLLGGGRHKVQSTIIGAVGGAAIGAGNAYAGKVGGDVILSTGVNAAAGAVVGNMVADGDSVMRIEDCTVDGRQTTCLWGVVVEEQDINLTDSSAPDYQAAFYNTENESIVTCDVDDNTITQYKNCRAADLISIVLDVYQGVKSSKGGQIELDEIAQEQFDKIQGNDAYYMNENNTIKQAAGNGAKYAKISFAKRAGKSYPAMISDVNDKTFGLKRSDWRKLKSTISDSRIYGRSANGQPFVMTEQYSINSFYPMYIDAEDGGIIDLGNKARLKGTLTGAGIGGAMGAFVGYQGAQQDIEDRWVSAVREYKDSLQKVYCATGERFLSHYNDMIIIPNMSE